MVRNAIVIFLMNYCVFLWAQPSVTYSRIYLSSKKNIPLAISNTHPDYFFVLRYNKEIHDLTIERRKKPSAEIASFTPLKLDDVNASWFNYEYLDYLFFEIGNSTYFVFEKVLNFKREVFMKVIDTTGRASDFIQLAGLEKDKNMEEFKLEFKRVQDDKLLIVTAQHYFGGLVKKEALLYDLQKREKVWFKKLADENEQTGYSHRYQCNKQGDLFFMLVRPRFNYYKRKFIDHKQEQVAVFSHDLQGLVRYTKESVVPEKMELALKHISKLYSASISANNTGLYVTLHISLMTPSGAEKVFYRALKWSPDFTKVMYDVLTPLQSSIEKQLTYYDGTDDDKVADKDFYLFQQYWQDSVCYILSERKDESFSKEILLAKFDLTSGKIISQQLIPRKILYYKYASRFRHMGSSSHLFCNNSFHSILMESARNAHQQPAGYSYYNFSKLVNFRSYNLVSYCLNSSGALDKKFILSDQSFDYIPLMNESSGCDFVMYFNQGKHEKFAILNWNL